jgi:hypothetical protein
VDALPPYNEPAVAIPGGGRASDVPGSDGRLVARALQTWLRYIVPLTLLSALALSPVLLVALMTPAPADAAAASALRVRAWELVALAAFCQLLLVGGASAASCKPSQLGALAGGAAQLVRAVVPCLAAAAAVAIGSLALVLPGLVLLVLLALTGASRERGAMAALLDSIAVAGIRFRSVAITVLAMLAIDVAVGVIAHRMFGAPLGKRPSAAQLVAARHLVYAIAAALVVVSPLAATVLATIRTRGAHDLSARAS